MNHGPAHAPAAGRCRRGLPIIAACVAVLGSAGTAGAVQVKEPYVSVAADGTLHYRTDADGHRIFDFSSAGYRGGGIPLPVAPVRAVVAPQDGDDGATIQAAIDRVAALPPDEQGLRGAVWLQAGRYEIDGQLRISTSGIVLRGAGAGERGTVLVATGTGRRTLIEIAGSGERVPAGAVRRVLDEVVPVGATMLRVEGAEALRIGDRIVVERPGTAEWIEAVGQHVAPARTGFIWKPAQVTLRWDRIIRAIDGDRLTLDAPVTTALEARFGGGQVVPYAWPGRITQVGVEHLRCESAFDPSHPADEEHAWMAVSLDAVENAWVTNVVAQHFVSSAVHVGPGARAVTVQDCTSLAPVSEPAGYRRLAFHTSGELTLFQRCRAEDARHPFTVGYLATGPNVFLDCEALRATWFSGSLGTWASGLLFDNVTIDGGALALDDLETWNGGTGWAAANSVLWQCSAPEIICRRPPTAQNWAVGVWGQFRGHGAWDQVDEFVRPESLYRTQLKVRAGDPALAALAERDVPESVPVAAAESLAPIAVARPAQPSSGDAAAAHALALRDGWLIDAGTGAVFIGTETPTTWWRGSLSPARRTEFHPHLTRFAPGFTGRGGTEDLPALAREMVERGQVVMRHHYGLWYDRRRDDHQRMRRGNADVWPPFYEQPWARSGHGVAWDGMSRYDLTRYNPWYFGRLQEFAELGRERGLVLVHEMYFQHNILESGAHWVDSPWRPVNALQETGFPEPPPFTGDTIKVADWFYDVAHPERRRLHRAYIRQCLAALAGRPNVIHTTSAEYSGPRHFVEFWLDVIAEWQTETGQDPLIGLSVPKDVQDAILADPRRAALIDVLDFTYWWRTDTALYAPRGGENLAPRQHLRKWRGGPATATSLAGMVREYRQRFPEKAVMTGLAQPDPWAFAAAGGSFAALPRSTDPRLLAALARMRPDGPEAGSPWILRAPDGGRFAVALEGALRLDLREESGRFDLHRVDPSTGALRASETVTGGQVITVAAEGAAPTVVWLSR